MIDLTETTSPDPLEAATQAVYDCEMSDGDTLAEIIHNSDYIDARLPLSGQIEQVKAICRAIDQAAITAASGTKVFYPIEMAPENHRVLIFGKMPEG
jgi:hypothetical protein